MQLHDGKDALSFLMGGNATITVQSKRTGTRFTYRVRAPREDGSFRYDAPIRFVQVLSGPDNSSMYEYIGYIRDGRFYYGSKSRVKNDAPSVRAFHYTYRFLSIESIPEQLDVFHEGKCARCGRKLTTPESIRLGFGAKCLERL